MTSRPLPATLARQAWRAAGSALALVAALLLGTSSAAPALAHHGWSGYDSSTLLTLTGTIVDVEYGNPHVMVTLAVPQEEEEAHAEGETYEGAEAQAEGELHEEAEAHAEGEYHEEAEVVDPPTVTVVMAPPFRSESRGLSREMLAPGVVVTFEGYLHKTTALELRAERIIIGDLTVELR